jgi:hypothetical protein
MRKYPRVPQPFVILPPAEQSDAVNSQELSWGIRLFGRATRYWPYVIHVFRITGEQGLGKQRCKYQIKEVIDSLSGRPVWVSDDEDSIPPMVTELEEMSRPMPSSTRVRWSFLTPTKLVRDGCAVGTDLMPLDLLLAGRRRSDIMRAFYSENNDSPLPLSRRVESDEFRVVSSELSGWGFSRYSGRQQQRMDLRGVVGNVVIDGPWAESGEWLRTIEMLHMGKATSFGFGQVRWEEL